MARPHKIVNNGYRLYGEYNPNCKYSDSFCKTLKLLKRYYTYKQLSETFEISAKTIQKIILYRQPTHKIKIKEV